MAVHQKLGIILDFESQVLVLFDNSPLHKKKHNNFIEENDFWPEILHHSLDNSTTHITIVRRLKKFHFIAVGAIGCNYPLKREREERTLLLYVALLGKSYKSSE